jgi:hypothetical protein
MYLNIYIVYIYIYTYIYSIYIVETSRGRAFTRRRMYLNIYI